MKKIVVVGGAGFIGSHIVEETCRDHEVLVFDNLHTGFVRNIEPFIADHGVTFVEGSIMDAGALERAFKGAESVFHLAALISVPQSMSQPAEYVRINTLGTLNVLEAVRRAGVKNVVLSSSSSVYGDKPTGPKREDMLPEPKSPYAVTKLDGESFFRIFREEHGINATALRYFNVFGPRQDPASEYAAAIPIFVSRALRNEPIGIFGDGEQTRDFIYVKDVVQANLCAARIGGDVFNVALGGAITITDLAKRIIEITGSKSKIEYLPERAGDVKHSMADNSRIVAELGFRASSDLEAGLAATVEYFTGIFA